MGKLTIDNLEYHYTRQGSGIPLVALHGFTGSSASWLEVAAYLDPRLELIAIDLPGHGHTTSPPMLDRYRMQSAASDLLAILDSLGMQRFNLLGYSMGGRLALFLASTYPDNVLSLVLESCSPGIAEDHKRAERRQQDAQLAEAIEQQPLAAFVDYWEQLPLFASQRGLEPNKVLALRAQRLQNNETGLANSLRGMGAGSQPSLWDQLPLLSAQTLLLCGDLDKKYVAIMKQMASLIPAATLRLLPDTGHNVHLERPREYAAVVSNFILQKT